MSTTPIITFKAGLCDVDTSVSPPKVKPKAGPGYIYLYSGEDELIHFCWRPRSVPSNRPTLDLVMVPTDAHFTPYVKTANPISSTSPPINGRIYVLKFSSSSQRHFFWLQSKSQSSRGDADYWSTRDRRLGEIVDELLQGEEVDVPSAIASARDPDPDDDESMEDAEGTGYPGSHHQGGSGGAGPGATGGDIRDEGEEAREGGADGARATANDASQIVQNFLDSLKDGQNGGAQLQGARDKPFTTLPDLLPPSTTLPIIESASEAFSDKLLSYLPPQLLSVRDGVDALGGVGGSGAEGSTVALQQLSLARKKEILGKVLRSPQFTQSLGSLTVALRDGGLPSISEALGVGVKNGGFMQGGGMPLGGGEAVEAFLEGVKEGVLEEDNGGGNPMDTD
ncbi:MAG: hypothetical protein M1813_002709 [Trichoglossum hirsutum]|nr:MAG: hypothetical protein M1813_002709 [Trichoglossum hirsutum]